MPIQSYLPLAPLEAEIRRHCQARALTEFQLLGGTLHMNLKRARTRHGGRIPIGQAETICEQIFGVHARCIYGLAWDLAPHITPRRAEVLTLIAEGYSSEQIARRLGVTYDAIKCTVDRTISAIGARSRTHAVVLAHRAGLIDLGCPGHLAAVTADRGAA